jgi:hypothetical protein
MKVVIEDVCTKFGLRISPAAGDTLRANQTEVELESICNDHASFVRLVENQRLLFVESGFYASLPIDPALFVSIGSERRDLTIGPHLPWHWDPIVNTFGVLRSGDGDFSKQPITKFADIEEVMEFYKVILPGFISEIERAVGHECYDGHGREGNKFSIQRCDKRTRTSLTRMEPMHYLRRVRLLSLSFLDLLRNEYQASQQKEGVSNMFYAFGDVLRHRQDLSEISKFLDKAHQVPAAHSEPWMPNRAVIWNFDDYGLLHTRTPQPFYVGWIPLSSYQIAKNNTHFQIH